MTEQEIIVLPAVRLSFPHLFEKQPLDNLYVNTEEKRKYVATFLLSKDDVNHVKIVKELKSRIDAIIKEIKIKPAGIELIKDGDEEYNLIDDSTEEGKKRKAKSEYKKGHYIIVAANKQPPKLSLIKGQDLNRAVDQNPFYPGCYVHALIELSPYKFNNVWKGISNRLHHVLFYKDGDMFGRGVIDGTSEFDKLEELDTSNLF
jgi:hypothetical protein